MSTVIRYGLRPPFTENILRASGSNAELHFLTREAVAEFVSLNKHRINNLEHFEVVVMEYSVPVVKPVQ